VLGGRGEAAVAGQQRRLLPGQTGEPVQAIAAGPRAGAFEAGQRVEPAAAMARPSRLGQRAEVAGGVRRRAGSRTGRHRQRQRHQGQHQHRMQRQCTLLLCAALALRQRERGGGEPQRVLAAALVVAGMATMLAERHACQQQQRRRGRVAHAVAARASGFGGDGRICLGGRGIGGIGGTGSTGSTDRTASTDRAGEHPVERSVVGFVRGRQRQPGRGREPAQAAEQA
jgi:hypothetical protein